MLRKNKLKHRVKKGKRNVQKFKFQNEIIIKGHFLPNDLMLESVMSAFDKI